MNFYHCQGDYSSQSPGDYFYSYPSPLGDYFYSYPSPWPVGYYNYIGYPYPVYCLPSPGQYLDHIHYCRDFYFEACDLGMCAFEVHNRTTASQNGLNPNAAAFWPRNPPPSTSTPPAPSSTVNPLDPPTPPPPPATTPTSPHPASSSTVNPLDLRTPPPPLTPTSTPPASSSTVEPRTPRPTSNYSAIPLDLNPYPPTAVDPPPPPVTSEAEGMSCSPTRMKDKGFVGRNGKETMTLEKHQVKVLTPFDTTVMIKNFPFNKRMDDLIQELDKHCRRVNLEGQGNSSSYDFVYVPVDQKGNSKGFGSVNFTTANAAQKFSESFNSKEMFPSEKKVQIVSSLTQGLQALLERNRKLCFESIEVMPRHFIPARNGSKNQLVETRLVGKFKATSASTSGVNKTSFSDL